MAAEVTAAAKTMEISPFLEVESTMATAPRSRKPVRARSRREGLRPTLLTRSRTSRVRPLTRPLAVTSR